MTGDPSIPPAPWKALWAVPIALAAIIGGMLAFVVATSIRDTLVTLPMEQAGLAGVAAHGTPPVLTLVGTFVQDLVLVVGVGIAVALALGGRIVPLALGLRPPRSVGRAAAMVIGAYVAFLVIAYAWTTALGIEDRENVAIDLGTRDSASALVGAILLVCAVAPLAEELFFRGMLFGALRRRGFPLAAGVSGLLFGFAHVASSPIGFIVPLALLGVLLALLYERTGSLYVPIALHCLNNSIAFGASDGRVWLVPVCLVGAGAVIVAALWAAQRLGASSSPTPRVAT